MLDGHFLRPAAHSFGWPTLMYLIAEHACLTILSIFSTLLALIRSYLLEYFEGLIHPARLLGPAQLIEY